jgi:hypothetical protein
MGFAATLKLAEAELLLSREDLLFRRETRKTREKHGGKNTGTDGTFPYRKRHSQSAMGTV